MRRLFLLLLTIALIAAACGNGDTEAVFPSTTATPPSTAAPTTEVPPPTTTSTPTVTTSTLPPETTTTLPPAPPTTVPVTTDPGLPTALSRSLIPLGQIDQGWVAVVYSADRVDPYVDGPSAIYLVDPQGNLFELAAFAAGGAEPWDIGNIANDATHLVAQLGDPITMESRVVSIDFATGEMNEVVTVESGSEIGTTLPTGRDVVVHHTTFGPTMENLDVYRTNGALFAHIESIPSQSPGLTWLYGLDGTYLLVGHPDGSLRVYGNDGTHLRDLNTPPGYCRPVRWWDAQTILAGCVPQDVLDHLGFYNVLWLIPIDGSPGTRLTGPPPPDWDVVEFGHADAWRVGGQVILQWWGDCAARGLQTLEPDGTGNWWPNDSSGMPWVHAQAGDDLVVHGIEGCGDFYGPVDLLGSDGSLVRNLVPHLPGYEGVTDVAGMIPIP